MQQRVNSRIKILEKKIRHNTKFVTMDTLIHILSQGTVENTPIFRAHPPTKVAKLLFCKKTDMIRSGPVTKRRGGRKRCQQAVDGCLALLDIYGPLGEELYFPKES